VEIDRAAGTYSVARFSDIATAMQETVPPASAGLITADGAPASTWRVRAESPARAASTRGGAEHYAFTEEGASARRVKVAVDRSIALSREALEVVIGAAYPNPVRDEHEPLLQAARRAGPFAAANAETPGREERVYGLPVEQSFLYSDSGLEVSFRSTITRVGAEAAPSDALLIPPGARLVEARAVALRRELRELDQPVRPTQQP
jgi:hypothetical protein